MKKRPNLVFGLCAAVIIVFCSRCTTHNNESNKHAGTPDGCDKILTDSISNLNSFLTRKYSLKEHKFNSKAITDEDELLLKRYGFESTQAVMAIERTKDLSSSAGTFTLLAAEIKNEAIIWMQAESEQLGNCTAPPHRISGLKIIYGLSPATAELKLYYQPVYFCRNYEKYGNGGHHYGNYTIYEGTTFYEYTTGDLDFKTVTAAVVTAASDLYKDQSNGIIFHRAAPQFSYFTPGANSRDVNGDIESIIFSFQEIYALMESDENKGTIKIWNAMEDLSINNTKDLSKHILLISSDDVSYTYGRLNRHAYGAKFANLSHFCPPSCNSGDFTFVLVD